MRNDADSPVRGIKEKRGIIYKAPTARWVLQYGRQRSGKGVHYFWIVTRGQKIHMSKFIRRALRVRVDVLKMYLLRAFIFIKYENIKKVVD